MVPGRNAECSEVLEPGLWTADCTGSETSQTVTWRNDRATEQLTVTSSGADPKCWTARVRDLDRQEQRMIATGDDRDKVIAAATEWLADHPRGTPPGFFGPRIERAGGGRPR